MNTASEPLPVVNEIVDVPAVIDWTNKSLNTYFSRVDHYLDYTDKVSLRCVNSNLGKNLINVKVYVNYLLKKQYNQFKLYQHRSSTEQTKFYHFVVCCCKSADVSLMLLSAEKLNIKIKLSPDRDCNKANTSVYFNLESEHMSLSTGTDNVFNPGDIKYLYNGTIPKNYSISS